MNKAVARCEGCRFFLAFGHWWYNTLRDGHCMNKNSNFKARDLRSEACWLAEPRNGEPMAPLHEATGGYWLDPR